VHVAAARFWARAGEALERDEKNLAIAFEVNS
jgi:hypothetical protein